MFENVDGRTDDGVTGILIAHLGAFGSGELKKMTKKHAKLPRGQVLIFQMGRKIP